MIRVLTFKEANRELEGIIAVSHTRAKKILQIIVSLLLSPLVPGRPSTFDSTGTARKLIEVQNVLAVFVFRRIVGNLFRHRA